MLGPMGAVVMNVLKVMTPSEIERYSQGREAEEVSKIAAGAESISSGGAGSSFNPQSESHHKKKEHPPNESLNDSGEAKIIPIREQMPIRPPPKAPPPDEPKSTKVEPENELEGMGIVSGEKQHAIKEAASAREKSKQDSATIFILKERERLKKSKSKMNTSEAFKTYAESSNLEFYKPEIEVDLDDPDKEEAIGSRGILINKKHY